MARRGGEWKERDNAIKWVFMTILLSMVATFIFMMIIFPVTYMIENGFSKDTVSAGLKFIKIVTFKPSYLMSKYFEWIKFVFTTKQVLTTVSLLPSMPFFSFFMLVMGGLIMNPYGFMSTIHGDGRLAEFNDIKKMGLFDGFIVVLGKWRGRMLMLPETLSVLVCAPPGTGKTVGVVVPTIFNSKGISLIINDPKPELCFKTSGQRIKEGPVFIVNWGAEDDPDNGVYYPSWNALSPSAMPSMGPARDMYVDMMVSVLVEEPKGGADPHWAKTGRNALTGFIHYITNKCERARANDYFIARFYEKSFDHEDKAVLEGYYMDMQDLDAANALNLLRQDSLTLESYVPIGTWELLPEEWVGAEPSIAMILDWLTEAQMAQAADIKKRTEEGDQMAALADPMRDLLDDAVNECRKYGYAHRAVVELNQLSGTPDKERGSILSTALTGIGIFKNSAVRSRTKFSDFTFRDLRGMRDPITGEWKPISVYMSVNQVDARALNIITGTFVELMSGYLIANPPNFVNKTEGRMGPCPTLFVLDEFPQMPKLGAVKDGPAVGRGQKVSYLLIGQDLGQISGQYGKDDLETIISTTAAKIILPQNNEQTAQRFEKMIGTKTVEIESWSRQEGLSQQSNPFSKNVNRSLQGTSVVGASTLLSLPALKQVIIMQGFINRPVMADAPRYYLDKKMLAMSNLPPAPFVPDWIVAQREDNNNDILANLVADDDEELEEYIQDEEAGDDSWEEYEEFEEDNAVAG
ncbi:MAG: type IV secretory system conjugative DNA transfer family protein [Alphaproteobacteria bacterium]